MPGVLCAGDGKCFGLKVDPISQETTCADDDAEELKQKMERGILLEFSRCIGQIVESAKGSSKNIQL